MDPSQRGTHVDDTDARSVADLLTAYGCGIDNREWDAYRTLFTDEVDLDFPTEGDGPRGLVAADTWVQIVRASNTGFDATSHLIGSPEVVVDGGRATARAPMMATHSLEVDGVGWMHRVYGQYTFTCVETDSGWRIHGVRLVEVWDEGDRATTYQLAHERAEIPLPSL